MQRQWLKMARRVGISILVIALAVQAYLLRGSRFTNVTTFAPTLHRLRCSPPLRATHHDDLGRPQW